MPPHSHISYWSSSLLSLLCLLHFKTDLHNFHNVSLQISICICPEFKIYVSEIQKSSSKGICQTLQSWWQRDWWGSLVFIKISQCNCPNFKMYMSKFKNVSVQISKCICPNFKMYLPNTVIPMIKRLVGLAGLLSSLSLLLPTAESFMNCSVLLSTNIFSSSTMVMMILMISRLAPKRYPPKIYPPKMCLPKWNQALLPAL